MPLRHRSIQSTGLFFATTSTEGMINRFLSESQYQIVEGNIEYYRKRDQALIHGYVVMPNHFHLLISIPDGRSISSFMRDLKKRIAFEYYKLKRTSPFPFWEHRFDDVQIYSDDIYYTKLNYIHNNPVKAGFVSIPKDWLYSSAKFYCNDEKGIVEISPI